MVLLKSRLENLPFHCAIKDRLASQQTVLFNLISQQDSSVNIGLAADSKELAAASKRDSSSMKIIAILTTLFLPGTFISVSFSLFFFFFLGLQGFLGLKIVLRANENMNIPYLLCPYSTGSLRACPTWPRVVIFGFTGL